MYIRLGFRPNYGKRKRGGFLQVRDIMNPHVVSIDPTESAALACARAVAASNLLKCAIAGNDPNWGRIVSSLGTVPVEEAPYDSQKVTVDVNGVRICENGGAGRDRSEVDMTPREVHIDIDLNAGDEQATVWTDDLTHEYVHINADYES